MINDPYDAYQKAIAQTRDGLNHIEAVIPYLKLPEMSKMDMATVATMRNFLLTMARKPRALFQ